MNPPLTVLHGNAPDELAKLPAQSVHMCVTSPPYWGLRDYGIKPVPWPAVEFIPMAGLPPMTIPAQDAVLGLERDRWSFVAHIVHVFRGVHRVLRNDGTLWLNFGDSYAANHGSGTVSPGDKQKTNSGSLMSEIRSPKSSRLKPKDLVGIPWRVAFALQADGWYLRIDNIWHKPNPMPESVTNRPTKAHEYLFLFTKSPRYFYDAEAIKETCSESTHARISQDLANQVGSFRANGGGKTNGPMKAVIAGSSRKMAKSGSGTKTNESFEAAHVLQVTSRNKRSVWTVPSAPYRKAHFATFPPKLITPCILAGTSARGCCPQCGAGHLRIVENGQPDLAHQRACGGDTNGQYTGQSTKDYASSKAQDASATKARILAGMVEKKTTGWQPSCKCENVPQGTIPAVVLDPFGGSGTTGQVALSLGRHAILIEANHDYLPLIQKRCHRTAEDLHLG